MKLIINEFKEIGEVAGVVFNYSEIRAYISTVNKVEKFFNKIGSSNLRNIIKFKHYLKNGYVLKSYEIERFLTYYSKVKLPYYALGL